MPPIQPLFVQCRRAWRGDLSLGKRLQGMRERISRTGLFVCGCHQSRYFRISGDSGANQVTQRTSNKTIFITISSGKSFFMHQPPPLSSFIYSSLFCDLSQGGKRITKTVWIPPPQKSWSPKRQLQQSFKLLLVHPTLIQITIMRHQVQT